MMLPLGFHLHIHTSTRDASFRVLVQYQQDQGPSPAPDYASMVHKLPRMRLQTWIIRTASTKYASNVHIVVMIVPRMNFLARVKVAAAVSRPLPSLDFGQEGRCVLRPHFRYPIIHSAVLHPILPLYGRSMSALHLEVSAMSGGFRGAR